MKNILSDIGKHNRSAEFALLAKAAF